MYKVQKIIKIIEDKISRDIRTLFEQIDDKEERLGKKINFTKTILLYMKVRAMKNKTLSIEEYLSKIRSYLKDIINDPKRKYHT